MDVGSKGSKVLDSIPAVGVEILRIVGVA